MEYDQTYLMIVQSFCRKDRETTVTICIIRYEYDSTHFTLVSAEWMECPDVGITEGTYRDCQVSGGFQGITRFPNTGRLEIES